MSSWEENHFPLGKVHGEKLTAQTDTYSNQRLIFNFWVYTWGREQLSILILPPNSIYSGWLWTGDQFSSVAQSCPTLRDPMNQHARPPCPSPAPRVYPNPCPLSRWCHPTTSSSVVPFSSLQSFPASGSFQMSQLFTSGGQSIGVSALDISLNRR